MGRARLASYFCTSIKAQTRCRFSFVARMFASSVGAMMDGEHAFATSGVTAW